jgi:hypothetical protein
VALKLKFNSKEGVVSISIFERADGASARPIAVEAETKTAFQLSSPADCKEHAGVGQAKAEASFPHSKRCREVR